MQPTNSSAPIRVLVVDADRLYREGLALVLSREPDIRVVAQARSASEAIERSRRADPDIVISEQQLASGESVHALFAITQERPEIRIIVLTTSERDADAIEAIRAGARGYVTKDTTVGALANSIRRVARGEVVVPARLATMLLEELTTLSRDRQPQVTPTAESARVTGREREVLALLVHGATNRDIARQLVITENTVKVHLRNILEKLHLRNRQQAAAYAIGTGLVELKPADEGSRSVRNGHAGDRRPAPRIEGSAYRSGRVARPRPAR